MQCLVGLCRKKKTKIDYSESDMKHNVCVERTIHNLAIHYNLIIDVTLV